MINSLQLPNSKYMHVVYISIIAALLLGATVGPSLLRAAAQEDDARILAVLCNSYGEGVDVNREGRTERISFGDWLAEQRPGLVVLFNEVGCAGISIAVTGGTVSGPASTVATLPCFTGADPDPDCIKDRKVDLDGDGTPDVRITTRQTIVEFLPGSVLVGKLVGVQTIWEDLHARVAHAEFSGIFSGTVGDSEPGSMVMGSSLVSDRSEAPAHFAFSFTYTVLQGSGLLGLEGICGGGLGSGEGPPFLSNSQYEFRFGSSCN